MFTATIQAAIDAAVAAVPDAVEVVPGRTLIIDGDSLAYVCSGNNETPFGVARGNMHTRIRKARLAAGAEYVKVVLTASYSHKGRRFEIATVKPYQGNRGNSKKPTNWAGLRSNLVTLTETSPEMYALEEELEADDLMAAMACDLGDLAVIYSPDKDLRMVPCWHLTWQEHAMVDARGAWKTEHGGKVYGHAFFWHQMLAGDTADNIPGLPLMRSGEKMVPVGEVRAKQSLQSVANDEEAFAKVYLAYRSLYPEDGQAATAMLEQGLLLWLRRNEGTFDVLFKGAPMSPGLSLREFTDAAVAVQVKLLRGPHVQT
jgi:DNA polymerase-1